MGLTLGSQLSRVFLRFYTLYPVQIRVKQKGFYTRPNETYDRGMYLSWGPLYLVMTSYLLLQAFSSSPTGEEDPWADRTAEITFGKTEGETQRSGFLPAYLVPSSLPHWPFDCCFMPPTSQDDG